MAQPNQYNPTADFSQDEASGVAGRSSLRTANLDAELSNIATSINQIIANLALIQRDDTELADTVVKLHTLSSEVRTLMASATFTIRGTWGSPIEYAVGDLVVQSGSVYLCMVAHTSGTFATDVANGLWGGITNSPSASVLVFTPTSTITAGNVQAAIQELDTEFRPSVNCFQHANFGGL
jgi:hypothetical protein